MQVAFVWVQRHVVARHCVEEEFEHLEYLCFAFLFVVPTRSVEQDAISLDDQPVDQEWSDIPSIFMFQTLVSEIF